MRHIPEHILNKHITEIREQGFTILDSILTIAESEELRNICIKKYDKYKKKHSQSVKEKKFHGSGVKMLYNLHNKHERFLDLIFHANILYIANILLR